MAHKYVIEFSKWTRINENQGEDESIERIVDLTRNLIYAISRGPLETSDLMVWFHGMMDVYDNSDLKALVFKMMKPVWGKYFKQIRPLLSKANTQLTEHDIKSIMRYKSIASNEATQNKDASDLLRELGLEPEEKTAEQIFKEHGLDF